MRAFWLKFTDGTEACCEGQSEYDAKIIAEKISGKTVAGEKFKPQAKVLPYPRSPVVWQFAHPVNGLTPQFCYGKGECLGKTSCPQNYACTE